MVKSASKMGESSTMSQLAMGKLSPLAHLSGGRNRMVSVSLQQLNAGLRKPPTFKKIMAPGSFLGFWSDSFGNSVFVQSTNSFEEQLVVTFSRPPRPDMHVGLWQTLDGSAWKCGNADLDLSNSSEGELRWVFYDGRVSVWTWQAFSLEALSFHSLKQELPQHASEMPTFGMYDRTEQEYAPAAWQIEEQHLLGERMLELLSSASS